MSASGETAYSFRTRVPDVLERGRANTVQMAAYRDGSLVAPTANGSTFSLVDENGDAVVSAAAVTVSGSIATYTIPALSLPSTLELGERYQERWSLVMPDGITRVARREAVLDRYPWHCPIADVDLTAEYPDLLNQFQTGTTTLQGFIDEAARQFLQDLWTLGKRPGQIVSIAATARPVAHKALMLAFKFLAGRGAGGGGSKFEQLWKHHDEGYKAAFATMTFKVDADDDGVADDDTRKAVGSVVHRNVPPKRRLSRSARW